MKITVEYEIKIKGDCSEERAKKAFSGRCCTVGELIFSEEVDGTQDFLLKITGQEIK